MFTVNTWISINSTVPIELQFYSIESTDIRTKKLPFMSQTISGSDQWNKCTYEPSNEKTNNLDSKQVQDYQSVQ